jgi:hypothetical protein
MRILCLDARMNQTPRASPGVFYWEPLARRTQGRRAADHDGKGEASSYCNSGGKRASNVGRIILPTLAQKPSPISASRSSNLPTGKSSRRFPKTRLSPLLPRRFASPIL